MSELERKLSAARYAYHKQIIHKYKVQCVMPHDEAAEMYRRSMENYDAIINDAVSGASHEANEEDMAKGFQK